MVCQIRTVGVYSTSQDMEGICKSDSLETRRIRKQKYYQACHSTLYPARKYGDIYRPWPSDEWGKRGRVKVTRDMDGCLAFIFRLWASNDDSQRPPWSHHTYLPEKKKRERIALKLCHVLPCSAMLCHALPYLPTASTLLACSTNASTAPTHPHQYTPRHPKTHIHTYTHTHPPKEQSDRSATSGTYCTYQVTNHHRNRPTTADRRLLFFCATASVPALHHPVNPLHVPLRSASPTTTIFPPFVSCGRVT